MGLPRHKKKKIYLAARFSRQKEIRLIREALTASGQFVVLGSWLDEDPSTESKLTRGEFAKLADKCLFEINKAQVFVCFVDNHPKSIRGGHQAEFGYALAKGKVLVSVGSVELNVFHQHWRVRQFLTTEQFLQAAHSWKNFLPPLA